MSSSSSEEVVVVTGASGFLGQHVVRQLRSMEEVREIRALDLRPYDNKLGEPADRKVDVRSFVGDVCKSEDVAEVLAGTTTVIHTAGLVSFGTNPDIRGMQHVNVHGTRTVTEQCLTTPGIKHLIFTSTVDVVIGDDDGDICGLSEDECLLPSNNHFLFPGYPQTKLEAEDIVLAADGNTKIHDGAGERLRTVVLRCCVMYGELDPYYVTSGLKAAAERGGVLIRVGNGRAIMQQAYAGNVAWAHCSALKSLKERPAEVGGKAYFIGDDTPPTNSFSFMQPFLEARQFRLSQRSLPYPLAYWVLTARETALRLGPRSWSSRNRENPRCSLVYVCRSLYFNTDRATRLLHYTPKFSQREAMRASIDYYKTVSLDNITRKM